MVLERPTISMLSRKPRDFWHSVGMQLLFGPFGPQDETKQPPPFTPFCSRIIGTGDLPCSPCPPQSLSYKAEVVDDYLPMHLGNF